MTTHGLARKIALVAGAMITGAALGAALMLVPSVFAAASQTTQPKAPSFIDIAGSPYRESIRFLAERNLAKGYPDFTFRPKNPVTRAEMATWLVSAFASQPAQPQRNCFRDVTSGWYEPFVCAAKLYGTVSGYPDGRFRPTKSVSLDEAFVMALKAAGFSVPAEKNQVWYEPAVAFMHRSNIFSKYATLPSQLMTREQTALMLHQLLLMKEGKEPVNQTRRNLSAGCGKDPPKRPPTASKVNGLDRSYITVIPETYQKNQPLKIIFAFHGRTNSNQMVRGYYRVEQAAGPEAIMVYPSGLRGKSGFNWSNPGDPPDKLRDFALFDQFLKEFSENYCLDLDHVYVVGHSLGAWFTNSLACARGNVIRAIGSVGGGTTIGKCTDPVAAMIWHNPKDNLVVFAQGERARDQLKNQNQCSNKNEPVAPSGTANCRRYLSCNKDAPLIWCPHHEDYASWDGSYYPHTWPRDAGSEIWKFFKSLD